MSEILVVLILGLLLLLLFEILDAIEDAKKAINEYKRGEH